MKRCVLPEGNTDLFKVVDTGNALYIGPAARNGGQREGGQEDDDGDNDYQLDKSKGFSRFTQVSHICEIKAVGCGCSLSPGWGQNL